VHRRSEREREIECIDEARERDLAEVVSSRGDGERQEAGGAQGESPVHCHGGWGQEGHIAEHGIGPVAHGVLLRAEAEQYILRVESRCAVWRGEETERKRWRSVPLRMRRGSTAAS